MMLAKHTHKILMHDSLQQTLCKKNTSNTLKKSFISPIEYNISRELSFNITKN